jgi:hypothetical protein
MFQKATALSQARVRHLAASLQLHREVAARRVDGMPIWPRSLKNVFPLRRDR